MRETCGVPRIVVSSCQGKAGKTTATLSLYASLTRAGYRVSMFKVGPDFIDPSYHQAVSGRPSRNLDHFLMGDKVTERFCEYSAGSDVALIEGVHSLYDSMDGYSEEGSTAQAAKLLRAPILLVINGERVNRTATALVLGLKAFDPAVRIGGAFLTNVTEGQAEKIRGPLESMGVPVLGTLFRSKPIQETMQYRHLGLIHMQERDGSALNAVTTASSRIDSSGMVAMAKDLSGPLEYTQPQDRGESRTPRPKIAIAHGRAFSFNYPETVERAAQLGDVRFFDPETDQEVDAELVIMGGGFPEIYAEALEKNKPMMASVRRFAERGGILYAECGGLTYLSDSLRYRGVEYNMVGIFDAAGILHDRRVGHGYVWGKLEKDTLLGRKGDELKGHEFHYTELRTSLDTAFRYERGRGISGRDGLTYKNVYAHFMHLHPASHDFVGRLVQQL
ncbi:MAG: cobyrinate a,c-diamide synthase [Nitrososphaerota archaeon]|nr:cobyrinate a,c-diamide synthase [Nitrososphaerota archaeon]MDG7023679.1 cobyrinate a,c-diamide synthase [Nitrososphaerota archaeon]